MSIKEELSRIWSPQGFRKQVLKLGVATIIMVGFYGWMMFDVLPEQGVVKKIEIEEDERPLEEWERSAIIALDKSLDCIEASCLSNTLSEGGWSSKVEGKAIEAKIVRKEESALDVLCDSLRTYASIVFRKIEITCAKTAISLRYEMLEPEKEQDQEIDQEALEKAIMGMFR